MKMKAVVKVVMEEVRNEGEVVMEEVRGRGGHGGGKGERWSWRR